MYTVNKNEKEKAALINAEVQNAERQQVLMNFYQKWKKDTTLIDEFKESKQVIIRKEGDQGGNVLVESCVYIPSETDSDIIGEENLYGKSVLKDLTASQQKHMTSLPFVKILASTIPDVNVGEIYTVKDKLASIEHNPEYTQWYERRANMPTLEDREPQPARFKMGWDNWEMFSFKINKFSKYKTIPQEFVYLVPALVLITKSEL
jgi:hypothetical protein